jgi:hypothetical protein
MTASLLALALLISDDGPPKLRVGVFDVTLSGIDASVKTSAIDAIATAAAALPGAVIVTKSELEAMLGAEKLKDTVGCNDISCLAEIGAAAGVDRLVAGSATKLESEINVSLQLINTRYATVENRVTVGFSGGLGNLPELLAVAAEMLLLPAKERTPGSVRIGGVPADALVFLDDAAKGTGPQTIAGVSVGVHTLRIEAQGHEKFLTQVIVRHGQVVSVPVILNEKKQSPFYTKWYFWTPIAAVLVGGAVTAAVLATRPAPNTQQTGSGAFGAPDLPPGVAR